MSELITAKQLAVRWQVSEQTLANWRSLGSGPKFVKLGGSVRYSIEAIEEFEAAVAA